MKRYSVKLPITSKGKHILLLYCDHHLYNTIEHLKLCYNLNKIARTATLNLLVTNELWASSLYRQNHFNINVMFISTGYLKAPYQ